MVGVPFIQESGCEMCSWDQHRIETTGVCSELVQCTSPKHPQTSLNRLNLDPIMKTIENLWQVLQQSKEIQTRPDTTRLSGRCEEPWLLWIGADAAIVDFGADVLRQLLRATDSHVQACNPDHHSCHS